MWSLFRLMLRHRHVRKVLAKDPFAEALLLAQCGVSSEKASQSHRDLETLLRRFRGLARRIYGKSACLDQAIALSWHLRMSGYATVLRIGVRRKPTTENGTEAGYANQHPKAHAWVELNGIPLLENVSVQQDFVCFEPLAHGTLSALQQGN